MLAFEFEASCSNTILIFDILTSCTHQHILSNYMEITHYKYLNAILLT
jgi:hypothetical protein